MKTTALVYLLLFVCNAKAQTTLNTRFDFLKPNQTLTANNLSIQREATFNVANEDADHLHSKADREKISGITLMCLGTIFLAGAITTGVMSTGSNNDLSNKNLILRGTCLGSAALAGVFYGIGIPLTAVGVHRTRKYK